MGEKNKKSPPVPNGYDKRAEEQDHGDIRTETPKAPDGISGDWA